jgi:hypothetical protein
MADVPLALAIVSTVSPVVAGAIPVVVGWIRDSGRDKREQAERAEADRARHEQKKLRACVKLLRLARDFRVLVQNTCDSRGSDLADYAEQIRQSAANISGQADEVGFIVSETEAPASSLATEARMLAETIADSKNREFGASILTPDFTTFDQCFDKLKAVARAACGYPATVTVESAGNSIEDGELRELTSRG